jgi:hypothetical protein
MKNDIFADFREEKTELEPVYGRVPKGLYQEVLEIKSSAKIKSMYKVVEIALRLFVMYYRGQLVRNDTPQKTISR